MVSKRSEAATPGTRARGRARSKTRSPARKAARSPARRSPGRPATKRAKTPPPAASTPRFSPAGRSPLSRGSKKSHKVADDSRETVRRKKLTNLDVDTDSDTVDSPIKEKPKATVRGRSRRLEAEVEPFLVDTRKHIEDPVVENLRRVTRSSHSREVERVVHLRHFEPSVNKKLGEFSDEDDVVVTVAKRESVEKFDTRPYKHSTTEFGGLLGALFFIVSTPISVVALHVFCNESSCSFVKLPSFGKYALLSTYFDVRTYSGYAIYSIFVAMLMALPFGGRKVSGLPNRQGKLLYTTNGFFSFLIVLSIVIGLEMKGFQLCNFVIEHLFQLLIASIVSGFIITTYAYIRSFYVSLSSLNAQTIGQNWIYCYFMGRELNPRFCGIVDLKFYVLRLTLIGSILLDFILLYRNVGPIHSVQDFKSINLNPTLILFVIIHSIYLLDGLIYEATWVTSFEIQYEGFGYMGGVGYSIYPFMAVSVTKYIVDYNVELALWKLVLISIVFLLGYILFRGSNSQKDAFRKNPYNPSLSHLETIPTGQGRKLIVSSFWGVVRHPNYLGDILMNLSFVPFALYVPPILSIFGIILLLIHRSVRDNARCRLKYGAAWDRYCSRVKYVLVPKIY